MQEAHIQEVLNIHAAKLTEQDLAQQTALGGTADKDTVVERIQLIATVLKTDLQMTLHIISL